MSKTEMYNNLCLVPPIQIKDELFVESSNIEDSMLGRGLWLNENAYIEGYAGTAILLLDMILISKNNAVKDSYIFVSLFCFRHFLELSMKDTIKHVFSTSWQDIRGHNLKELYKKILEIPNMNEDETTRAIKKMIDTINDYDPSGTAFRYPYSVQNDTGELKTTMRYPPTLIEVRTLKTRLLQLYAFFDGINSMVQYNNN